MDYTLLACVAPQCNTVQNQSFWQAFLAHLARVCPLVVGVLPEDAVLCATRNDIWPFGWIITNSLHPEGKVSHLGTLCLTCQRLSWKKDRWTFSIRLQLQDGVKTSFCNEMQPRVLLQEDWREETERIYKRSDRPCDTLSLNSYSPNNRQKRIEERLMKTRVN